MIRLSFNYNSVLVVRLHIMLVVNMESPDSGIVSSCHFLFLHNTETQSPEDRFL